MAHADFRGDLPVAALRMPLEASPDQLAQLLAREMPAVQIEVLGEFLLLGIGEPRPDVGAEVADAELGGDPEPVGAVDDVVMLVDDDRNDDAALAARAAAARSRYLRSTAPSSQSLIRCARSRASAASPINKAS